MMKIVSPIYVPELGMEDLAFFHQYPMDSNASPTFDNFGFHHFDNYETTPNYSFPAVETGRPNDVETKPTKTTSNDSNSYPSPPKLISFEHTTTIVSGLVKPKVEKSCIQNNEFATPLVSQGSYEDHKIFSNYNSINNRANQTRNTTQAQEHVIAERKRREKLTRSFIALSAIVPGLKKMDKASILGDAIKYMKKLQTRLQTLEEEAEDNKKTGSTVQVIKKSVIFTDNDDDHDEHGSNSNHSSLPEIEIRVSSKDILIKIQCDKHNGHAVTLFSLLENLNLTVISSTVLPFGNNILDLTIVAQMNKENCMTAKDLLGRMRQALHVEN